MKPSAQITIGGLVLLFVGSIITTLGWSATISSSSSYSGPDDGSIAAVVIGLLVLLAGAILTLVGIYRALSKIDALPFPLHTVKQDEQERGQADQDAGDLSESGAGAPASSV